MAVAIFKIIICFKKKLFETAINSAWIGKKCKQFLWSDESMKVGHDVSHIYYNIPT